MEFRFGQYLTCDEQYMILNSNEAIGAMTEGQDCMVLYSWHQSHKKHEDRHFAHGMKSCHCDRFSDWMLLLKAGLVFRLFVFLSDTLHVLASPRRQISLRKPGSDENSPASSISLASSIAELGKKPGWRASFRLGG